MCERFGSLEMKVSTALLDEYGGIRRYEANVAMQNTGRGFRRRSKSRRVRV